jgi:hypothetical protein
MNIHDSNEEERKKEKKEERNKEEIKGRLNYLLS